MSREIFLRNKKQYKRLSRWVIVNHLKAELAKIKPATPAHKIILFLTNTLWHWVFHYLLNRFGRKHNYEVYSHHNTGIYKINPPGDAEKDILISIAADWATCTPESFKVAEKMKSHNPDYTIHAGDTYYVGSRHETYINFLAQDSPWIRGSKGSFALLGNHEMYARGIAYFDKLLPSLGIKHEDGKFIGQHAAYFCLENDYWRVLGLDTGFHSVRSPIFELFSTFAPDCRFDSKLVNWLRKLVKLDDPDDKRGIVIITHHQYISSFGAEREYTVVGKQLAAIIGTTRPVIWLFGHEHKLAVYNKVAVKDGVTVYGRCIGNGGMPIELDNGQFEVTNSHIGSGNLVGYDKRPYNESNPSYRLGYNGYAHVRINGKDLWLEYFDTEKILLKEHWITDAAGVLRGDIVFVADKDLTLGPGKKWDDATS